MAARRQNCFTSLMSRGGGGLARTSKFPAAALRKHCRLACLPVNQTWAPAGPCVADRAAQEIIERRAASGEWRASFCTRDMFLYSDTDMDGQGRDRAPSLSSTVGTGWMHIVHGI
jgi:hypothetical protein